MKNNINTSVVVNIIRTITMTILSLVTFPYVCRILGDAQMGVYSWVSAFIYYFFILARISIPNIAVRECVKVKNDPEKLSMKIQELFIIQAVMTLISFGLMSALIFSLPSFTSSTDYQSLAFILSLNFLVGVMSFEWVFTAFEKHIYMSVRSIIIYALSDILIFVFVKNPGHIYLYAFISILGTVLIVISNLCYLPAITRFKKVGKYNFKQYLPILSMLFLISIVVAIYDKTDTFILGLIDESKRSVGSYSVGMKGVEIIIGIITSLSIVFIPRATYYYQKNDEKQFTNLNKYSFNIALFIVLPAIAMMTTLATPITSLFSGSTVDQYINANVILMVLSSLMLTYSLSFVIYTQILISQKKEKYYLFSMLGGALLNIGLSLLFGLVIFKDNPAIGVSVATSISDLIVLITLFALTWKDSKALLLNLNNLKLLIISGLIAVVTYFLGDVIFKALLNANNSLELSYIFEILIMLSIDIIIYLLLLFISKEKLFKSMLSRYKK